MIKHAVKSLEPRTFVLSSALAEGTAIGAAAVAREAIPVLGSMRGRIRVKLSVAGATVAFKFIRPNKQGEFPTDGTSAMGSDNPADLVIGDTTEVSREIDFYGEAVLLIEVTDDGDGCTIEHITVSML